MFARIEGLTRIGCRCCSYVKKTTASGVVTTMRPVTWLHTSDFHLRESHVWSQDAVLSAMRADLERRQEAGLTVDFIIASGDLAFSGKTVEYDLVSNFFQELVAVTGVPRERIFFVAGNHDVDRERQTLAFTGARLRLQSEGEIYAFLSKAEERETLLKRLDNFRSFQESWSPGHTRTWTPDGLGYVSTVQIEDLRIGIVGFNSAWLAEGGMGDHGKLLLGESQVREALRLAQEQTPHIIIAMAHHPLMLLQNFDRAPTQRQIEGACQFFHCGHLHEPDTQDAVHGNSRCLTLSAGASFDSREYHNAYSIVTLLPMLARRSVTIVQFNPHIGEFSYEARNEYPLEIDATQLCSIQELATAIEKFAPSAACPFYLAALLLKMKAEVPIAEGNTYVFGTAEVLRTQPDGNLRSKTLKLLEVGNVLRLFSGSMRLADILNGHGRAIREYAEVLASCCNAEPELLDRLTEREYDARALAKVEPLTLFEHTLTLLDEFRDQGEWDGLRRKAQQLVDSPIRVVALKARRLLALCLGRSIKREDNERAIEILRDIDTEGAAQTEDIAMLATILTNIEDYPAAKAAVLSGMETFPGNDEGFVAIGIQIVEATGDHEFRNQLSTRRAGRSMS
jgi:hypothetical protein